MLKTLQLYTICIVILVIVLSQITFFTDDTKANYTYSQNNTKKVETAKKDGNGDFFEGLKNSKYGEPLVEISKILDGISNSKKNISKNLGDLTNLLDIEKNINDLYSFMEQ